MKLCGFEVGLDQPFFLIAGPWFLACQAHPEFLSTPRSGHPLFIGFVRAARECKAQAGGRLLKEASA